MARHMMRREVERLHVKTNLDINKQDTSGVPTKPRSSKTFLIFLGRYKNLCETGSAFSIISILFQCSEVLAIMPNTFQHQCVLIYKQT